MREIVSLVVGCLIIVVLCGGEATAQDQVWLTGIDVPSEEGQGDSTDVRLSNGAAASCNAAIGDINCNGIPFEIADVVMFSNYFVHGLRAFGSHVWQSIAASDVDGDHKPLRLSDCQHMVIIMQGFAHYDDSRPLSVLVIFANGTFSVDGSVGAAFIIMRGHVTPSLLVSGMEMKYDLFGGYTRILVFSFEGNSFDGDFIRADGDLVSIEFASCHGQTVKLTLLEVGLKLHQNYPNPFNTSTTIRMDIPFLDKPWRLDIFNVLGQVVKSYSGMTSGFVSVELFPTGMSSGVYFYQLRVADSILTRKMTYLK